VNEHRAVRAKLNPTIFDKLISDDRTLERLDSGRSDVASLDPNVTQLRLGAAQNIERFNETALRNTIRRELNWLLNTTWFASVQDLSRFPEVKTSVLNYGVPDLTGRSSTPEAIAERGRDLRQAITVFEPRIDPETIEVEVRANADRDNTLSFFIRGDISSAVKAMPVNFVADVEVDTGATVVRD
jgi:type VI secretion system protein ImpF